MSAEIVGLFAERTNGKDGDSNQEVLKELNYWLAFRDFCDGQVEEWEEILEACDGT